MYVTHIYGAIVCMCIVCIFIIDGKSSEHVSFARILFAKCGIVRQGTHLLPGLQEKTRLYNLTEIAITNT